jgi:hypothetical protein
MLMKRMVMKICKSILEELRELGFNKSNTWCKKKEAKLKEEE